MPYECRMLDAQNKPVDIWPIEAADEREACVAAEALAARHGARQYEVWREGHLIRRASTLSDPGTLPLS